MKKNYFYSSLVKEEQEVVESLMQSITFSDSRNSVTNFLTEFEQSMLEKIVDYNYPNCKVEFFGGIVSAERKKSKLIVNDYYDVDYDIVCLKASYNSKFFQLKHKDVLGAVHNLGLNFNRFGDIFVENDSVYLFVDRTISDYIKFNFEKIGKVNLKFEELALESIDIKKQYEQLDIVTSSFRIDNIVSKITNKSRSKVKEMLEQDFIKLNHVVLHSGEKNCSVGDMISIRRYGRYTLKSYSQNKKSLKYRITVNKLI